MRRLVGWLRKASTWLKLAGVLWIARGFLVGVSDPLFGELVGWLDITQGLIIIMVAYLIDIKNALEARGGSRG